MNARILLLALLTLTLAQSPCDSQQPPPPDEQPAPQAAPAAPLEQPAQQEPPADMQQPAPQQEAPQRPAVKTYRKGVIIEVSGVILPMLQQYLNRKLEQAKKLGANLVILQIDSPGGELGATLEIAERCAS